jgi:acyl carrier protein
MVPAAYVMLDALPLTPNGKLDRKRLPAPEASAYAQREYEVPQGPIESALAQIWADLLHVDRVGRHDHFFELGGHSLLVTKLIARVSQRWDIDIPFSEVFSHSTLSSLSNVIVDYELNAMDQEDLESVISQYKA